MFKVFQGVSLLKRRKSAMNLDIKGPLVSAPSLFSQLLTGSHPLIFKTPSILVRNIKGRPCLLEAMGRDEKMGGC